MPKKPIRTRQRPLASTTGADTASPNPLHGNLRLHIRYAAPKDLTPPARKLRKHSKRQLEAIQASMRAHGFLDPILVDAHDKIVCGYGRWLAASGLGLELVPVITAEHLSHEQLRVFAIAENRLGDLSEFDLSELKVEFEELTALDCELNLEVSGFSTSEIDDLVFGKPPEFGGNAEPQVKGPAVTLLGDLWQLGNHRLYCGNSLEEGSYVTLMGDEKAGMVFADPPYNLSSREISGKGKHRHSDFGMAAGEMSISQFTTFLSTSFKRLCEFSLDGSIHFQCMDWKHMREMLGAGYTEYTELKNLVIYVKPSAGMGTFYRSQHELVFVWKAGTAPHVNNFGLGETGRHRSNVWSSYKGNAAFHRDRDDELAAHPTVKPWGLVADAIRDCSKRGAIVLDPFGGYGTTMIAAERTGRKARLIELDPLYCDASIHRWEKLSGKQAILLATGETFVEVAASRGICLGDDREDEDELSDPAEDGGLDPDESGEDA